MKLTDQERYIAPSLSDWMDRWEQEYEDGQTMISCDEAVRRWEQEVKDAS